MNGSFIVVTLVAVFSLGMLNKSYSDAEVQQLKYQAAEREIVRVQSDLNTVLDAYPRAGRLLVSKD